MVEGKKPGRKAKSEAARPARSRFGELVSSKTMEISVAALLFLVTAIGTAVWKFSESFIESYIISALEKHPKIVKKLAVEAAVEDIAQVGGKLAEQIGGVFAKIRQSEVGMISVGRFTLTADEQYVLYVYFPEGYSGKITYQIDGEVIADKRFVLVQSPNGEQSRIRNLNGTIDIPSHIKASTKSQNYMTQTEEPPAFLRDLRGFTFQLVDRSNQPIVNQTMSKGESAAGGQTSERLKVDISYVAYVTPAIQIK